MEEQKSPFKFEPTTMAAIAGGAQLLGGIFGSIGAGRRRRQAERRERRARNRMNNLRDVYSSLDTSNPYLNMQDFTQGLTTQFSNLENVYSGLENTAEDLTVNQQQAQFERQQFERSQASILGNLRGAAGGSGVASVAQALAQQGQLQAQRSAASIGQQEARNQALAAQQAARLQGQEAGYAGQLQQMQAQERAQIQRAQIAEQTRLQGLERQGDLISREQRRRQVETELGMAQAETMAYGGQAQQAQQGIYNSLASGIGGVADVGISYLQGEF
tara:strand:+ start:2748 stop:3569 length:822 start_codon:yes stop_codon:yes gene_type:complete